MHAFLAGPTAHAAPVAPRPIVATAVRRSSAAAASEIVSTDGVRLAVRPMLRSDGGALAAAVAALSPQTRYLRFLTPKPNLSNRDIAALTDLDHHARGALVGIEPRAAAWAAVARYAAFGEDPLTADVAVTVGDRWQRRGI